MAGLIPFGELDAAGDLTTAALVQQPTRTQYAVDGRISHVAADVIAEAAPEIVDAAVTLAQSDAGLVRTVDPRLLSPSSAPHAWGDHAGRASLYDDQAGHVHAPMPIIAPDVGEKSSAYLTGHVSTASGRAAEDVYDLDGTKPQWVLDRWAGRMTIGGEGRRRAGVQLSCAGATTSEFVDSETAVQVRVPVKLAATTSRWRLHVRNFNERTNTAYPGALTLTDIYVGAAALVAGAPNGEWETPPVVASPGGVSPADASEWVSQWVTDPDAQLGAYEEHLIAFGYTCAAQDNHKGVGTAWRSAYPAEVADVSPSHALTLTNRVPLEIWIEVEVPASTRVVAFIGDSLTAGTGSSMPVRDSYPAKWALAHGAIATHYANHGSESGAWSNASDYKWVKHLAAGCDAPDSVFYALGSNDIFNGTAVATFQTRTAAVLANARALFSDTLYAGTILPRSNGDTDEPKRVEANDWLWSLPFGIQQVYDLAGAVESAAGGSIDARFAAVDQIHITSGGYGREAAAITSPLGGK